MVCNVMFIIVVDYTRGVDRILYQKKEPLAWLSETQPLLTISTTDRKRQRDPEKDIPGRFDCHIRFRRDTGNYIRSLEGSET